MFVRWKYPLTITVTIWLSNQKKKKTYLKTFFFHNKYFSFAKNLIFMKKMMFTMLLIFVFQLVNSQILVKINNFSNFISQNLIVNSIYNQNNELTIIQKSDDKTFFSFLDKNKVNTRKEFDLKINNIFDFETEYLFLIEKENTNNIDFNVIDKKTKISSIKKTKISNNNINLFCQQNYDEILIVGATNKKIKNKKIFIATLNNSFENLNIDTIDFEIEELNNAIIKNNFIYLIGTVNSNQIKNKRESKKNTFLLKWDIKNKRIVQIKTIESNFENEGLFITKDNNSRLLLIGSFEGEFFVDKNSVESNGAKDIFIGRINDDLNVLSLISIGSDGNDYFSDLKFDKDNNIYITGTYRKQINEQQKNDLFFNTFIAKISNANKINYVYTINDTTRSYFSPKIILTDTNTIIIALNSIYEDNVEVFLYEYADCQYSNKIDLQKELIVEKNEFTFYAPQGYCSYLWNTGITNNSITFTQPGTFYLTVKDKNGCISFDSINVFFLKNNFVNPNIETNKNNLLVDVFPNPVVDNFNLTIKNLNINFPLQIIIYSEGGSIVEYKKIEDLSNSVFNISMNLEVTNSKYVLKIINGTEIIDKKIVIIK